MSQEDPWKELHENYKEEGLVLALGAGVSMGCKLPSWGELLCRLAERCLGKGGRVLCQQLMRDTHTYPAIASILEENCPHDRSFSELIRKELYKDFKFFPRGVGKDFGNFIGFVQKHNPTMRAIASLCARREKGDTAYSPNPFIHALVNFNLDSVLQAYMRNRYQARLLRTIERPSAGTRQGRINIYHMHGFIRFDEKYFQNRKKEAPDTRVFTEQEYFDFFNASNTLFNYTFLHLLREFSCLFIGLSMKDDNIRRLLHYSKTEREHSHIREGRTQVEAERRSIRHFAILPKSESLGIDRLIETSLMRLGTRVLWVKDFKEISEHLADLYECTGDDWQAVY